MRMRLSPKPVGRALGPATRCLAALAFAAPLVLGFGLAPAQASTTVTYSQTGGGKELYAAWQEAIDNQGGSNFISSDYTYGTDFTTPYYQLMFPSLALPTGATITSAVLAYQLAPSVSRSGPEQLETFDSVDRYHGANPPTPTAQATDQSFLSLIATGDQNRSYTDYIRPSAAFVLDGPEFNGLYNTLDLLSLGLGPNLSAGYATEVDVGTEITSFGSIFMPLTCIGCEDGDGLPPNFGYNADATYQAYVQFPDPIEAVKLIVTYDSPITSAAPEPAAWALMLLGFGGLGATLRRQRRLLA